MPGAGLRGWAVTGAAGAPGTGGGSFQELVPGVPLLALGEGFLAPMSAQTGAQLGRKPVSCWTPGSAGSDLFVLSLCVPVRKWGSLCLRHLWAQGAGVPVMRRSWGANQAVRTAWLCQGCGGTAAPCVFNLQRRVGP